MHGNLLALLSACVYATTARADQPTKHVDQFIGTSNGGHVFAGASLPWGSVKAVADCNSGDNQAGFVSDGSPIRGISPLHDDGTGGGPSLGMFKVLPMFCNGSLASCDGRESSRTVARVEGSQAASPGYFAISLASGIKTEVTATHHTMLQRLTYSNFSSTADAKPVVLFDLTNDLQHSFHGGQLTLNVTTTRGKSSLRVTSSGKYNPSFGTGDFTVYSCWDVPGISAAGYWINQAVTMINGSASVNVPSGEAGALAQLDPAVLTLNRKVLLARMGVSYISTDRACQYAANEIPAIDSAQFERTRAAATTAWDKALGTITVDATGQTDDFQKLFWSSLYRTYLSPMNITGDNPLWESGEPYYDSLYCIWDSFRVVHPLFTITQRGVQAEVVRALIEDYRQLGWMPDCRMSLDKGFTQGGSNADMVLGESYVKGIKDGINWADGLAAMRKDAEVQPGDWAFEGRGNVAERASLGWVPMDGDMTGGVRGRTASRTLEYASNDFAIALVANGLGDATTATHYANVSGDWKNLWNPDVNNTGYSGFIQPRFKNGSFAFVDPRFCSPVLGHTSCFLNDQGGEFYEASSWEYSYYVPHDQASVVTLMGGPETYVERLDAFFENGFHDIGDEPGFLPCFLYNYAGRPDKTVDRVLTVLHANYSTAVGGLPGNDDSGAMGGFVVFAAFGFYPIAGTSIYVLSAPLFKSITFPASEPGRHATIIAHNFDGATKNKYIVSAKLNGRPFTRSWFAHGELFGPGGTLELVLGPTPGKGFGTAQGDLPPSFSVAKSLAVFS